MIALILIFLCGVMMGGALTALVVSSARSNTPQLSPPKTRLEIYAEMVERAEIHWETDPARALAMYEAAAKLYDTKEVSEGHTKELTDGT